MTSAVIPLRRSAVESTLKVAAFEQLRWPAACANAAGQLLAVNAAFATLVGLPADRLVGQSVFDFVAPAAHERFARRWAQMWDRLRRENRACGRLRWQPASGRPKSLRVQAQRLVPADDEVACLLVQEGPSPPPARRMTPAEQARREALGRCAQVPAFLLGPDRRVQLHNAAADSLRDDPALDFLGLPFDYLLDEPSAGAFRREFDRLLGGEGATVACELRQRAGGDGQSRRWRVVLENRLHDPELAAVVAAVFDLADGVPANGQVERAQGLLRSIGGITQAPVLVLDASGAIVFASYGALRALGRDAGTVLGRAAQRFVRAEDQSTLAEVLNAARRRDGGAAARRWSLRLNGAGGAATEVEAGLLDLAAGATEHDVLLSARGDGAAGAAGGAEALRQSRRIEFRERLLELAIQPRGDFPQALARLLRVTAETLKAGAASFWLHDARSEAIRCESMFVASQNRFAHDWIGVEFPGALYPAYLARLRARQPLAIGDLHAADEFASLARHRRWSSVRALLDVPVLIDGDVHGVLSLHREAPRGWDEEDVAFAGNAALMIALAMEAAQRQQAESRIEQLAWYDPLTGLPNRNLLRESLRDMVATAESRRRRIALLLIDLDRFKDVNDTLGHLVGDALIKSAAQLLRDLVGSRGLVGRLGGDEFVVVLNEFEHRQEVALFATRIAQALHRTDLVPQVDTQVSASIGIALYPEHGREMSTLLKNADSAMYQAKRDGRNQFSFFNPIRYEHAAREVQLGIQLLKALHAGATQFFVEYQPQVRLADGRVVGLEALIRWQHPTYGRLTPDRFIGVAEVGGLSERITRWLIDEVCAQILRWRSRQSGFDIPIAVNIAGRELGSTSLPGIVRSAFERHGIQPHMITLEVTERTLVRQNEINNDVMAELAALGVGLVLDDFGTGYSMLGYLKRMPIQALKIDGSFVEGVPGDGDSCAIVHAMLAVARHFKLKVVAEGVETAEQAEYLRSVGCEYAQGFHYSRPLLPQTILDYIELGPPETARVTPQ